MSLSREHAATLLADGWRRESILALSHQLEKTGAVVNKILSPFAVNVGGRLHDSSLLIYKTHTVDDIWAAFELGGNESTWVAYCDGSGHGTKEALHPAGIGCVIYRPNYEPVLIAQNIGLGTNNRAELAAVWSVLRAIPDTRQRILVQTDSEYAIGALTKDWARNANAVLITNIRKDLALRHEVKFLHVDGHSGVEGNETADKLANIGRKIVTRVSVYES